MTLTVVLPLPFLGKNESEMLKRHILILLISSVQLFFQLISVSLFHLERAEKGKVTFLPSKPTRSFPFSLVLIK